MNPLKKYVIIVFLTLFVVVLLQNTHHVTLSFLFWHLTMPQLILIPALILLGFIIGYFTGRNSW